MFETIILAVCLRQTPSICKEVNISVRKVEPRVGVRCQLAQCCKFFEAKPDQTGGLGVGSNKITYF
jgi:hypothetical protein